MTSFYLVQFWEDGTVWSNETFECPTLLESRQAALMEINQADSYWRVRRVLLVSHDEPPGQWSCTDVTEWFATYFMAWSDEDMEPVTPIVEALIQRFYPTWENPDPDAPHGSSRNEHSTLNKGQQL